MSKRQSHNLGVISIEFSVGFFFFMALFFVWLQIAYMGYVSGVIDYAVAETARNTRAQIPLAQQDGEVANYENQFRRFLTQQAGIWGALVDPNKFSIKTYYYKTVTTLADACQEQDQSTEDPENSEGSETSENCLEQGSEQGENNVPVAVYQVSYRFDPIFNLFGSHEISLKREVFVVQEYERDKFYN